VGYSEKAGEMEFGQASEAFSIAHFIGVSGKLIRSTLAEQYSAVAFAGDIGYYMESPETGLRFGLSALNMGTEMKFIEEGDPLPLTVRTGFSWSPDFGRRTRVRDERNLLLALDGDYLPGDRQWHANFGAEYIPLSGYSIRVGYRFNRDLAGVTFGFGGDFRDMRLAYSWGMQDSLSDVHRISITYRFGKVPGYKREFKRRPYIESMPEREELRDIEDKTPRELDPPRRPRRQAPDSQRLAPGWIY
jgi:hypothetical protein